MKGLSPLAHRIWDALSRDFLSLRPTSLYRLMYGVGSPRAVDAALKALRLWGRVEFDGKRWAAA